jgi:hypothetical protein
VPDEALGPSDLRRGVDTLSKPSDRAGEEVKEIMENEERRQLQFKRSSRCEAGLCTEVAVTENEVVVRDSEDPEGPMLVFTHAAWSAFTGGVKAGDFDL